jgi:hypothetical protein
MMSANKLLLDPAKNSEDNASEKPADNDAGAVDMVLEALRSRDPEVIWEIGALQPVLDGDEDERTLRSRAWMLAACQRGYDCENSAWMEFDCRFDQLCAQDRNATDFFRRTTGLDFPEIEARAKVINANLDAEAWEALEREITN